MLQIGDRVKIKDLKNLEGKKAEIIGISFEELINAHQLIQFIILLDEEYNGRKGIVIPEQNLEKIKDNTLNYRSDKFFHSIDIIEAGGSEVLPFTSSITCYAGNDCGTKPHNQRCFIEIADCHRKVKLHSNGISKKSLKDFIIKINIIVDELLDFKEYLGNYYKEEYRKDE